MSLLPFAITELKTASLFLLATGIFTSASILSANKVLFDSQFPHLL